MSHRYLVLGLLTERPMTGYEIKKRVGETMGMIASPSFGALYPILHRLLEEGAVTVDVVSQEGRPAKKVYSITESGREDFLAWLRAPAAADQIRREFLLKVLLAHNLEPVHLKAHLDRRRAETEALHEALEVMCARSDRHVNGYHVWVIAYALEMCRAELRWLNEVERAFSAGEVVSGVMLSGLD